GSHGDKVIFLAPSGGSNSSPTVVSVEPRLSPFDPWNVTLTQSPKFSPSRGSMVAFPENGSNTISTFEPQKSGTFFPAATVILHAARATAKTVAVRLKATTYRF